VIGDFLNEIQNAMLSLEKGKKNAEKCPYRPQYHFLAPAYWMNDPNGLIFYKGEYHIFYQHNPYKDNFGKNELWNTYWGHAKSKDLIHWEHLPIALLPSTEKGEYACWSGCCINDHGIPKIIYTSVNFKDIPHDYSEQWLATSSDDLLTWKKDPNNPIMTLDLHKSLEIHDWRDPYVWYEQNLWYMVLGGHQHKDEGVSHGMVLLYKSKDLVNWNYLHPLCKGTRKQGRGWECPNFFQLNNRHILIVSPYKEVLYAVGIYKEHKFYPVEWKKLDLGRIFYAPNSMIDQNGRRILWGWIKGGGTGGWSGCLSLPRILTLGSDGEVRIKPAPELELLRENHFKLENIKIGPKSSKIINFKNNFQLEILIELELEKVNKIQLHAINKLELEEVNLIDYDASNNKIRVENEIGKLSLKEEQKNLRFHIFIDKSILEVFINNKECITTRIYPKVNEMNEFRLSVKSGRLSISSLDIWTLKSIW